MLNRVIERKRDKMISIAKKYGLASETTLRYSQELDKLINFDIFSRKTK